MQRPAKPSTSVRFRVPPPRLLSICAFWIDPTGSHGHHGAMKKFTFTLRWPIGDTRIVEWAETLEAARQRLARKYPACEIVADEDIPVYLRETVDPDDTVGRPVSAAADLEAEKAIGQTAT